MEKVKTWKKVTNIRQHFFQLNFLLLLFVFLLEEKQKSLQKSVVIYFIFITI